ncbi:BTB/POZ fold protein [Metarhizium rileyi]|uniref:BTB/POZ fold protein n=1 Tax=Metarhizium rileyi (strain RCEF 4871) TaxID=1649241 RepID=A0A167JK28_METRR|nr:BTB/POZ fold protein [Metarhizium rileyi RCEF 4871]TWU75754.1 hypothetical protein ED733_001920 [Metarhizium rileyi]
MPPSVAQEEPEQVLDDGETTQQGGDVEMIEENEVTRAPEAEETTAKEEEPLRTSFMSYLSSPIVTLVVGHDENQSLLTAHQALLCKSPYLQELCQKFVEDGSPRQIELAEDAHAVGSFLEFLYTGEYFPKKIHGQRVLEVDPEMPKVDDTGVHLLKHARVYTIAEKFGVPVLKKLSSSKIHCIDSTAKGEIEYARYVYAHTTNEDTKVRAPIASFWATRSHTLRAEAEEEFKSLCLEYPQFGYDVLTRVLDDKLKRERTDKMHPATTSGRKRARHSSSAAGSIV